MLNTFARTFQVATRIETPLRDLPPPPKDTRDAVSWSSRRWIRLFASRHI